VAVGVEIDRLPQTQVSQILNIAAGGSADSSGWSHPGGRASLGLFADVAPGWAEVVDVATGSIVSVVGSVGAKGAWVWDVLLPPRLMSIRVHNTGTAASSYRVTVVA
jgi:hypothetical protein